MLQRVLDDLQKAGTLLHEALYIGLWVKSEGSEDNRRKREALREADWAVAGAVRTVASKREATGFGTLARLERDLCALDAMIEPLPDVVTDWMGENQELDSRIRKALEEVERISEYVARAGVDRQ